MVSLQEAKNLNNKKTSSKKVVRKKSAKKEKITQENNLVKKDLTKHDHFHGISRSVSISCVAMTALVVTISPSSVWILGPVIGAMAIFGIAMGYFASK